MQWPSAKHRGNAPSLPHHNFTIGLAFINKRTIFATIFELDSLIYFVIINAGTKYILIRVFVVITFGSILKHVSFHVDWTTKIYPSFSSFIDFFFIELFIGVDDHLPSGGSSLVSHLSIFYTYKRHYLTELSTRPKPLVLETWNLESVFFIIKAPIKKRTCDIQSSRGWSGVRWLF